MTPAASAVARATETRGRRAGLVAAAVLLVYLVAGAVLPEGLPPGVVLQGLVLGSLTALTALGLVLVYRATRIINFAQAEIGGLAATVAIVMVRGWDLPYFAALPIGLAFAVGTGALVDATVIRRFFEAPRLILTVATIGLLQILGALEIWLPTRFSHLRAINTFRTPFHVTFRVHPFVFIGDHVLALAVVPGVLVALAWFFTKSDTGIAIRGAADSNERALLLGIPVHRLSRVTWMVAAGLSGVASLLSAPILGSDLGAVGGPALLLAPLTAAVVARMESLPLTVAAALGIGVFQQAVFWNYPRSSTVDVGLFVVIIVALLLQRRRMTRQDDSGLGGFIAIREVRPIPAVLRALPEVRIARAAGLAALLIASVFVPLGLPDSRLIILTYVAIYGIIAVSLVVLTGWAGQISLGHFAFVGLGAATTASLLAHAHADLFLALMVATAVGAIVAVLVGIPALRIPGLFLAVATLAFAVPVSTYVLNSTYYPTLNPHHIDRPLLLERFDLDTPRVFYYLCLASLIVAYLLARNFRRSRAGRAVLAVRDNERGAAAYAVSPVRAKLTAFALSGALAGFAGGLFVLGIRGIGFAGFDPILSFEAFTMVVVGGLASLPGALLGAAFLEGARYFLRGAGQLLTTGAGVLVILMIVPGGLGEVAYRLRDRLLRALAGSKGLSVPSLAEHPEFDREEPSVLEPVTLDHVADTESAAALMRCEGVDAAYGDIQVLFGVDMHADDGELVALLGTNGAGKSTALRVIAGLLPPTKGRVMFEGEDITGLGAVERVKRGIVTVPGGRGVFPSLTVAENLRLAGWLARRDPAFLADAMRQVHAMFPILEQRIDEKASSLSGGEQQMLTIAQAFLCRPRLLMIDELSLGLAPTVVSMLLDVVRKLNDTGTTIVIVEQSVNVATALAQRAVFMEKGQVRFTGATAELMERPDLLRSVFLRTAATARVRTRAIGNGHAADGAAPLLELHGVSRRFGGVTAVDDVDLTVRRGQVLGIIGSNGAGKTTLFDVCSGFLPADSGRIELDARDVTELGASDRAARGLGRSFQNARLFPSMTVTETLAAALERHVEVRDPVACIFRVGATVESEAAVDRRVEELVELMGLGRYRDAFVSELSTGTRRIVELTCAMAHDPSLLLLDEPSSGIAQRESEALAEVLLNLREQTGATMAVIEHDIPLISSIADEMVCLHLGRVIARGTPKEVLKDPSVVASYLGSDDLAVQRSGKTRRKRPLTATKER